jgi:hexosaminidase
MKGRIFAAIAFLLITWTSCKEHQKFDASRLELEWKFVGNETSGGPQFKAALVLNNRSESNLPHGGWKLYFSLRYHGYDLASETPDFELVHVSGELFFIRPTGSFKGLHPGESVDLKYKGKRLIANYQDIPSGFFWVNDNSEVAIELAKPVVSDSTREKLPKANAETIYTSNASITDIPLEDLPRVFPTPTKYEETSETFGLSENTVILSDSTYQKEAAYLADELQKVLGVRPKIGQPAAAGSVIHLRKKKLSPESYALSIGKNEVIIEANDGAGIFYGIQSLKTCIPPEAWKSVKNAITINGVKVIDKPRFPFRAFMLDVARNFQTKEEILKVLEIMSLYKLNVFHFHLTDDEGWRLEVPGIPELIEVGAKRGFPFENNERLHPSYGSGPFAKPAGNGYYTREDYIDIVRYATARHIRVVPEIESPGHARAAIKAMEYRRRKYSNENNSVEASRYVLSDSADQSTYLSSQYFRDNVMNVALPSTYAFIEKVIDELMAMHREAGAPLTAIHMAGDEVPFGSWEKSPAVASFLQANPSVKPGKGLWSYYFEEIKKILRTRDLEIYGWQELVVGTQTDPDSDRDDSKHIINPEFVGNDLQVDAWWNMNGNEDIPYKLANAGYKTVMTCFDHLYFDLAYTESFNEPGDAWIGFLDVNRIYSFIPYDYYRNFKTDVRGRAHPQDFFKGKELLSEKSKKNIMGIQGALWGENLISADLMEYLLVPRLLALAERAWSQDPAWVKEKDQAKSQQLYDNELSVFVNTLGKRELPRLNYYNGGINYRIPTPGATVVDGKVAANIQLPGFVIRYTTDNSEPDSTSMVYTSPVPDGPSIKLKAFDQRGRGSESSSILRK